MLIHPSTSTVSLHFMELQALSFVALMSTRWITAVCVCSCLEEVMWQRKLKGEDKLSSGLNASWRLPHSQRTRSVWFVSPVSQKQERHVTCLTLSLLWHSARTAILFQDRSKVKPWFRSMTAMLLASWCWEMKESRVRHAGNGKWHHCRLALAFPAKFDMIKTLVFTFKARFDGDFFFLIHFLFVITQLIMLFYFSPELIRSMKSLLSYEIKGQRVVFHVCVTSQGSALLKQVDRQ